MNIAIEGTQKVLLVENLESIDLLTESNPIQLSLSGVAVAGPQGLSGVISVTSPIVNSGSLTNAIIGINQSLIAIDPSQVTGVAVVKSAISFPYIAKFTNFDMTSDYVNYYTIDCTAAITVTLPDASVVGTGRVYKIKSSVSGTVTVNAASGQLIDGTSSKTITTQYSFLTVQSTGTKWITI